MQVKIQGTIVSPDYDDGFFGDWIAKGVITPSSRVVAALESSEEPVDVYINSYGGDVFAGGEMMIALLKAQAAGRLQSVEVGSLAASMAANIVAALKANGASICAHANTQLMFHGCYSVVEGGAQRLEDMADSLRSINESVVANLNRIGITECRAWFAEGREKWIDAPEAKELGLVDAILEDSVDASVQARPIAARLAAFASNFTTKKEYIMQIDEIVKPVAEAETAPAEQPAPETVEQPAPVEDPAPAPAEEPVEAPAEDPAPAEEPAEEAPQAAMPVENPPALDLEERVKQLASERFASLQAKHDKMISDITKERDEARAGLESAKAEATSLRATVEKLEASLAELRDQLAESERNRESIVASALKRTQPNEAVGKTARQTLASLPLSERDAYYQAHKAEIDGNK